MSTWKGRHADLVQIDEMRAYSPLPKTSWDPRPALERPPMEHTYGVAITPTTFLPMEPPTPAPPPYSPLRPVTHPQDREFFASLFGTRTTPNQAPYTHTLNYPPTEYDHNGYPLPPRNEPSMTITMFPPEREECDPAGAFSRAIETLMLYGLTPREEAAARSAVSQLMADYGAQTAGIGHVQHGQHGDWFRSLRWSPAAWQALHGPYGPRKGWER